MKFKTVGKTGIKVSELCFGTMSFGVEADEKTSIEMFEKSREIGINFFDTANVYGSGKSEEILGNCIKNCREDIVLSTKAYYPMSKDINSEGLSRKNIIKSIDDSLKRLQTDYIDFYFVHMFDDDTSIEETMRTLDYLQKQGKILYPAVSNWSAWQIAKAQGIADKEGLARFELIQPMYNLVKRQAEVEIFPLAKYEDMGVITYSPLGAGLLTGKYGLNKKPTRGRLIENARYTDRYSDDINFVVAEKFNNFAKERNLDPVSLVISWVMSNQNITAPIIGARNITQLTSSLKSLDIDMTPELREEITSLSPTPSPATDRGEVLTLKWK